MIQKILATAALALLPLSATLAQSTTAQNLPRADVSTEAMVALCQSRTDLEAQTFCYGFVLNIMSFSCEFQIAKYFFTARRLTKSRALVKQEFLLFLTIFTHFINFH